MVAGFRVRHIKSQDNLCNRVIDFQRLALPIGRCLKNQIIGVARAHGVKLNRQPATRIGLGRGHNLIRARKNQPNGNSARMSAINAIQAMRRNNRHYSIDALSRLSDVAATMGEITPLHFTFTQAVLPLSMARLNAGANWPRRVTNSPCPPRPSNML